MIPTIAIITIALLEYKALCLGIDGKLLGLTIAAISGLGGYELKRILTNRKEVKH